MNNKIVIALSVLIAAVVFPMVSRCQDVSAMFREAEKLETSKKETEALKKYLDIIKMQPSHLPGLCKISELYCLIGSRQQTKPGKLEYFKSARKFAETALKINPAYSEANFVMSLAMGRMALVLNGQEKIRAVNDIKKYAEIAIRTDPNNYKAYHVLGRWHFEVSSLNAFEKMGVKLIFGGLPPSSFAESIKNYEKSRSLQPSFPVNYLEIAKAYHKNDQDTKAIEMLKKLQSLPVQPNEDPRIRKEGSALLHSLQD